MNPIKVDQETRLQAQAEAAERADLPRSDDENVEAYRLVIRAATREPVAQLAPDFAASVAASVGINEQLGFIDRWLPSIAVIGLVIVGIATSSGVLVGAAHDLAAGTSELGLGRLPWPMLGAASIAMGCVAMFDRVMPKR